LNNSSRGKTPVTNLKRKAREKEREGSAGELREKGGKRRRKP